MHGKVVAMQKITTQAFTINMATLKASVYVLKIINGDEVITQKIIKD